MSFRKETRQLVCKLLPIEVSAKDASARHALLDAAKRESERLEHVGYATEARKQVKGYQATALEHAQVAAAGEEKRSVTCEWRPHPSAPRMQLHRLDVNESESGRIIEERQMSVAEKRGAYEDGAGDVPSAAAAASDSAAANGNGHKRGRQKKEPDLCPATIAEPDEFDATKDTVCGAPCVDKKWACERHIALPQSTKVHLIARQTNRRHLLTDRAAAAVDAKLEDQQANA